MSWVDHANGVGILYGVGAEVSAKGSRGDGKSYCSERTGIKLIDDENARQRRARPQFGLKAMFAAIAVAAIVISLVQWIQTDTIFYSDSNSILRLPNGRVIPTNRWIAGGDAAEITFRVADKENEFLIIQNHDSTNVAVLQVGDERYEAVVTNVRVRHPEHRAEYWLRPGNRIEP